MPHDILFGFFLGITAARLYFAQGRFGIDTLIFTSLVLAQILFIALCGKSESPTSWRIRLLFYPIAMNVAYFQMRSAVPQIQPELMDNLLLAADRILIGGDLGLRLQPFIHRRLTDSLSFCYLLFFPYLTISMIWYLFEDLPTLKKFYCGLFSIYGLGFLGYTLVPAIGPHSALSGQYQVALDGGWLTAINNHIVSQGSNGVDVFPSLHCAISSYFLFFDRTHKPWRFKLYLFPCIGLWAATIYLRYHYFIDILAGFSLSMFSLWLGKRYTGGDYELHPEIQRSTRDGREGERRERGPARTAHAARIPSS